MWANTFQPQPQSQPNHHNLLHDCIQLIRDMLAVANDVFPLRILELAVQFLDDFLQQPNAPRP